MKDFRVDTENGPLRISQKGGRYEHQSVKINKGGWFRADDRALMTGRMLYNGCPCLLSCLLICTVNSRFSSFVSEGEL